jgi:glucose/arabinose dehydrogenase
MRSVVHSRLLVLLACVLLSIFLSGCAGTSTGNSGSSGGSGGSGSGGSGGGSGSSTPATDKDLKTDVVATHLETPWSMVFAPDGRLFFTEQPGRLRVMTSSGVVPTPVLDLTGTTVGGEGGTTGMDLDPDFANNGAVYIHFCLNDGSAHCRVDRVIVDSNNVGTIDKVLLDYPVSTGQFDHTGGRLKVSPDHFLYLSTGDHTDSASAQDLTSWNGKILRMNLDGTRRLGQSVSEPEPVRLLIWASRSARTRLRQLWPTLRDRTWPDFE